MTLENTLLPWGTNYIQAASIHPKRTKSANKQMVLKLYKFANCFKKQIHHNSLIAL